MAETVRTDAQASTAHPAVLWLQAITLVWMLLECGVSLYSAVSAHSMAMLAFGADSLVELLSAIVVLFRFLPVPAVSERTAARIAGVLLFALAAVIPAAAMASVLMGIRPEPSFAGIAITIAALVVMPVVAWLKRRESHRTGSRALAADAVQSATCAWLAVTALVGLVGNALFHIWWLDSLAALAAIPLLLHEGRSAWRGHACTCC